MSAMQGEIQDGEITANPFRLAAGRVRDRYKIVVDPGFQPLPDVLLFHQADIGISSEELNVLLNILAHWYHPERLPFPRARSISKRMGVSERTVQRHINSLMTKGFVAKVKGASHTGTPSFDIQPLLDRLTPFAEKRMALTAARHTSVAQLERASASDVF